jgi:hypothetical protein
MRKVVVCLCAVTVFACCFIQVGQASNEMDALLKLLVRKGLITEQKAGELEAEMERDREAAKTELKVELKEELAEEGLSLSTGGRFKLYGSLDTVVYVQDNTNFTKDESVAFAENVARIGVKTELTDKIDADFRIVAANTAGDDGSLYGTTTDDARVYLDLANLKIKDVRGWPLTLIIGRQEIVIGDGFLIGDGRYDRAAQWLIPLKSFDAARATMNRGPFTLDLFAAFLDNDWVQYQGYYAEADEEEESPEYQDQLPDTPYAGGGGLYGANLHYEGERRGIWDLGVFYRDDDSQLRNNTLALSLKGSYEVPAVSGLKLDGEIVQELGRTNVEQANLLTDSIDRRALGGHLDLTYAFEAIRFAPYLSASYIYLPGDDPDTQDKNEAFDPLFFDDQDWGKWYLGNIVGGGGQIINSNERVTKLEAGCAPNSSTQLRLQYFNIKLDRGIDSDFSLKEYANEINLIFDYWPNEIFYCGAAFGYAHPLEAAKYWNADSGTGEEAEEDICEFIVWVGVEF